MYIDIFVTGARDGKVMIWDTRCNRKNGFNNPLKTISGAHVLPIKETTALSGKKKRSRRTSMYQAVSIVLVLVTRENSNFSL